MSDRSVLPEALEAELDEVLSLLPLVEVVPDLADRVFARLTDSLVEALLHDIRVRHQRGETERSTYLTEMCRMVVALEERDLLRRSGPVDPRQ